MEVIYLNNFPNSSEEINLIKFIAKYQYLSVLDVKYFFSSKHYYSKRITNLVKKGFLRRTHLTLVLAELGIEYVKLLGFEYNKINRNKKYLSRLLCLSHLAAFYNNCDNLIFKPSFEIKDKNAYTLTSRRFIGIFDISGIEYLVYQITEDKDFKYINSILYDIQKESQYKNIIILVDDSSRININDFTFGLNSVLVVEDNDKNRENLKYINNVKWSEVIQKYYKNKIYLSEYGFCDYTNYKDKFVSLFYYLDTEKINRIKYFIKENNQKTVDIICNNAIAMQIKKELPTANYIIIDLDEFIDKEQIIYD